MKKLFGTMIVLALALSGCSGLKTGYFQKMTVETEPANAVCNIRNKKGVVISSVVGGGTAYNIRRGNSELTVTCSKEGWADTQITVRPESTSEVSSHIFLGALTDILIQTTKLYPATVHVKLVR